MIRRCVQFVAYGATNDRLHHPTRRRRSTLCSGCCWALGSCRSAVSRQSTDRWSGRPPPASALQRCLIQCGRVIMVSCGPAIRRSHSRRRVVSLTTMSFCCGIASSLLWVLFCLTGPQPLDSQGPDHSLHSRLATLGNDSAGGRATLAVVDTNLAACARALGL